MVEFLLKEKEWTIGLVADSKRLLEVALSPSAKRRLRVRGNAGPTPVLRKAERMLRLYLRERRPLGNIPVDWSRQSPFQRKVLRCVRRIPLGEVRSYGWVARRIGKPKGARACGQALRRNRFPLFIPCHRVVGRIDLGGFSCGIRLKKKLLVHERGNR